MAQGGVAGVNEPLAVEIYADHNDWRVEGEFAHVGGYWQALGQFEFSKGIVTPNRGFASVDLQPRGRCGRLKKFSHSQAFSALAQPGEISQLKHYPADARPYCARQTARSGGLSLV